MLRSARANQADLIARLWATQENAMWIEPPEDGEIATAITEGNAFLWEDAGDMVGFAIVIGWVPKVWGLSALAVARPGVGEPMLRAVLTEVFNNRDGHRIGFDVTVDNHRALRLYDRLGFQREGRLRECWLRPDGAWVDCYLLGLLRREWAA
jgi:ribosomal protein S18 acetylase RimI-like enzyme